MRPVYITRFSKYLPNAPVSNDEMESVLGMVNERPSKARAMVLRNNGIKTRYYAFRSGKLTHTNAQLAAITIKNLFDENIPIETLQLITVGTTSPDQLLPSHAVMVHGELGIQRVELISATGACCSSIQAMKYAFMSVGSGLTNIAASAGSERLSHWMHASRFQPEADSLNKLKDNPIIAFEKDFLRWMLSDGAGAALIQATQNTEGISLRIEWIEITSYANELQTCMYAGAVKNDDHLLTGWNDVAVKNWTTESVFSLKQDTRLLSENIVPKGGLFLQELMVKHGIGSNDIDYYVPHLSSEFFKTQIMEHHERIGLDIPYEKWFYNLPRVGNVGSASAFVSLEELFYSGKLTREEKILVMVPESARFSYAYIYLIVV